MNIEDLFWALILFLILLAGWGLVTTVADIAFINTYMPPPPSAYGC